jgi:hypothetical protein
MFASGIHLLIGSWDRAKSSPVSNEGTTRESAELAHCLEALNASAKRWQAAGQLVCVINIDYLKYINILTPKTIGIFCKHWPRQ